MGQWDRGTLLIISRILKKNGHGLKRPLYPHIDFKVFASIMGDTGLQAGGAGTLQAMSILSKGYNTKIRVYLNGYHFWYQILIDNCWFYLKFVPSYKLVQYEGILFEDLSGGSKPGT